MKYLLSITILIFYACLQNDPPGKWPCSYCAGPGPNAIGNYLNPSSINALAKSPDSIRILFEGLGRAGRYYDSIVVITRGEDGAITSRHKQLDFSRDEGFIWDFESPSLASYSIIVTRDGDSATLVDGDTIMGIVSYSEVKEKSITRYFQPIIEGDSAILVHGDTTFYGRHEGTYEALSIMNRDDRFNRSELAEKRMVDGECICDFLYAYAITDIITNISLITLQPFGNHSTSDTLNKDLTISYTQYADFINSGYTLGAYKNTSRSISLTQFNQQKNTLVDPSKVELHFKSPLPAGSYSFQVRYSTARGKILAKDLDMVVE
jgi:hypothetical protein